MKNKINKINRIIIFNLESLYSGRAITEFFERYHDRIVLICASQRYGGKYGSFLYQFKKNLKTSGFNFVNYLSCHLIYYKPTVYSIDFVNKLLKRKNRIYTLGQLAKKYKVPILKTKEIKDKDVIEFIRKKKPDLIISAYFDHVINREIIDIPKFGVINIHTALLPEYKGPFPSLWPMIYGENHGGVTIHYVNEKLDEGDIIVRKKLNIQPKESILSMDCRFMNIGIKLLYEVIDEIGKGEIHSLKQTGGHYYSYPTKEDLIKLKRREIKLYTFKDFFKNII